MSRYTSPTPVSGFLDPNDPTLFPRLTAAQTEQLAGLAETLSFSPGEVLLRARFVVLAVGADYRRLPADGAERFEGLGLYYAATHLEAIQASDEDVVMVGGGNSAGQAVVNLASYARRIYLVVRRSLTATMSRYLIDRIEAAGNVEVWEGCEVKPFTRR